MVHAPFLAALLAAAPVQQELPGADQLVEQARGFLPSYDGEHRSFLTAEQRRHTLAAKSLLDAALALEPESAYALWWKGHSEVLLGEDDRNRGNAEGSATRYEAALAAFDRALALQPDHHWGWYARAMVKLALDRPFEAIDDLDRAIEVTNAAIAAAGDDEDASVDPRFVRFKARLWRADARMRVLDFERAREEFRSFYADNGNNRWDLGYSIAETYLRERDLAGAVRTYEELLAIEDYGTFDSTYAQLGYLAGLLGDRLRATRRLDQALERELAPGLYLRLWRWILAVPERREEALYELSDFVAHPPSDLSDWDLELGRFLTGEGTEEEFLGKAEEEVERRMREAEPLDDLMCEAWFYAGLRWEERAAELVDEQAREGVFVWARNCYRRALGFSPVAFKWEWAFARQRMVSLPRGGSYAPGFELEGDQIALLDGSRGTIERALVHTPGNPTSRMGIEAVREDGLLPGDLVQWVLRRTDGTLGVSRFVVDATLP